MGKLLDASGKLLTQSGTDQLTFVKSWTTTDDDNLFAGHFTPNTPVWTGYESCPVPTAYANVKPVTPSPTPSLAKYTPIAVAYTFATNAATSTPVPDAFKNICNVYCTAQFKPIDENDGCDDVMASKSFFDQCVSDCVLSGSSEFGRSHKDAYLAECLRITKRMLTSSNSNEVTLAQKIQINEGLGDYACPNNCGGETRGICNALACQCFKGWYGKDCTKSTSDLNNQLPSSTIPPTLTATKKPKCTHKL